MGHGTIWEIKYDAFNRRTHDDHVARALNLFPAPIPPMLQFQSLYPDDAH